MSREALCKLLKCDVPNYEGKELWIFGAGMTANLYSNGLKRLEDEGFYIKGYIDNNKEKWGTEFNGKKVVSLDDIAQNRNPVFVLLCSYYSKVIKAVSKQLDEYGISYALIDEIIFKNHADELIQVYDSFCDEESKEIYEKLIRKRIIGDDTDLPVSINEQYFGIGRFIANNPNEVLVECGSYVGDTIERYIWVNEGVFKKIIAFEPDPHNVKAMKYRIDRLSNEWGFDSDKIVIFEKGVADKNLEANIKRSAVNNGFSSNLVLNDESEGNDIVSLDTFIQDKVDFLKADIESWEYYMLLGAKRIIKEQTPKLAICIYHNAVDFYEIALLIKKLVPEYNIAIRHHSVTLCETVLYAWID